MPYHKYVFRDGKFVGKFEKMYQVEDIGGFDSWHQDNVDTLYHDIIITMLRRIAPPRDS